MRLCLGIYRVEKITRAEQRAAHFFLSALIPARSRLFTAFLPEYLCHGTWIENDTVYLVASTDVGRYCLVYSASAATTGTELSVTGHLASCPRASHHHPVSWQVNLTSHGEHY